MQKGLRIVAAATVLGLGACAHVHTLVPETASGGQLHHVKPNAGRLELTYADKTYAR
jgi:hypothetical protein